MWSNCAFTEWALRYCISNWLHCIWSTAILVILFLIVSINVIQCTSCVYSKTIKTYSWALIRQKNLTSFISQSFSFFSTIFAEIWRFGAEGEVFCRHQSRQNWRETITFSSKSGRTDCSFQSSILRVPVPTFIDGYVITECVCAHPFGTNFDATGRNHLIWTSLMCVGAKYTTWEQRSGKNMGHMIGSLAELHTFRGASEHLSFAQSSNRRVQQSVEPRAPLGTGRLGQDRVCSAPVLLCSGVHLRPPKKPFWWGERDKVEEVLFLRDKNILFFVRNMEWEI